jgi:tetratricopeptide (TPR) repeat protein
LQVQKKIKMNKILYTFILMCILSSCGDGLSERDRAVKNINLLENSDSIHLSENKGQMMDSLTRAYEQFVAVFSKDSLVPEYIFKLAGYQYTLGRFDRSLSAIDRLLAQYPNGIKTPEALFFKATIYHDGLSAIGKAEETWDELIKRFPESDLAKQAAILKQNSGADAETLFKNLMKKDSANN